MNTIKITIPEEVCNNIQRADIEQSSRKDIIAFLLENNNISITSDNFIAYQKEYEDKKLNFENLKNKLEEDYILPATNNISCNWSLNYYNNTITIDIME